MSSQPGNICPPDHKHGDNLTCNTSHGCTCPACRAAHAEYSYYRSHMIAAGRTDVFDRLVDATGTRRRIQALMTIGWSQSALARPMNTHQTTMSTWLRIPNVHQSTARTVAATYDEYCLLIPPTTNKSERMSVHRTRALAARRRWLPPLAWDDIDNDIEPPLPEPIDGYLDQIAIDLALAGEHVRLTVGERHQVVARLVRLGRSDSEIAEATGVSAKTIERDREHLGLESLWDEARRWIA